MAATGATSTQERAPAASAAETIESAAADSCKTAGVRLLNGINGVGADCSRSSSENGGRALPAVHRAAALKPAPAATATTATAEATTATSEKQDPAKLELLGEGENNNTQSTTSTTNGGRLVRTNGISLDPTSNNPTNRGVSPAATAEAAAVAPAPAVAVAVAAHVATAKTTEINRGSSSRSSGNSSSSAALSKQPKTNTNNKSGSGSGGCGGGGTYVYNFRALQEEEESNGNTKTTTLDIFTYHRGREGMELRDDETGNLLCDVPEPTDTNNINVGITGSCNEQGPKLLATVTIRIPIVQNNIHELHQEEVLDDDHETQQQQQQQQHSYFWETIKWDLEDADTASPMAVAANIAENFGLSFAETLQVAESIQIQLRAFCAEHAGYTVPLSYIDPSTERKRDVVTDNTSNENPVLLTELYGQIIGHAEGGLERCKAKEKSVLARIAAAVATHAPPAEPAPALAPAHKTTGGVASKSHHHIGKAPPKRAVTTITSGKMAAKRSSAQQRTAASTRSVCRAEVQKRLCLASADAIRGLGQITMARNLSCHICCLEQPRVGMFACGIEKHAYCVNHIEELLGLSTVNLHGQDGNGGFAAEEPLMWDHCPICALACHCEACVPKLEGLALEFQSRCMAQQCSPAMTEFTELFEYSKTYQTPAGNIITTMTMTTAEDVVPRKAARKRRPQERAKVAKLSALHFPREVSGGMDFDPGTPLDYTATYSEQGRQLPDGALEASSLPPIPLPFAGSGNSDVEDGSTDYCLICMGPGDLLCCDYCPRAFHAGCIDHTNADEKSDDPWRCPRCCLENVGLPEDKLDGSKSLSLICAAYESFGRNVSSQDTDMLRLLSIIHEMLLRLINYDFGYTFREPVDLVRCPGYAETVKRPMDLGTIATNLVNAEYHDKTKVQSLEDIAVDVLKDIELVWQNCFSFNFEGSAVYRMAEVLRRRAQAIRHHSFDDLLTDRIKRELAEYESSRVQSSRGNMNNGTVPNLVRAMEPTSLPTSSKSRNKISVSHKRGQGRVIGVLDPDTRRVVKMYSTANSTAAAVKFLLQLEHPCEFATLQGDTVQKVRKIVKASASDPTMLLFGHRWLYMDDLINGKVKFPKHQQPQQQPDTNAPPPASLDTVLDDEVRLAQFQTSGNSSNSLFASASDNLPEMTAVVKADLVSGRRVASFASLDAAYQDWLQTCMQLPLYGYEASRTMEVFRSQYLEGSRNVDGVVWRSVRATKSVEGDAMEPDGDNDSTHAAHSDATTASRQGSKRNKATSPDDLAEQASSSDSPKPVQPKRDNIPESQDEALVSAYFTNTNKVSHATAVTAERRKEALFDVSLRIGAMQNGTTNPLIRERKKARHDDL
jgi:Bromodomain